MMVIFGTIFVSVGSAILLTLKTGGVRGKIH